MSTKSKQSTGVPVAPDNLSKNDILESAETLRASNTLLRIAFGIVQFSDTMAGCEVIKESEHKPIGEAFDLLFAVFQRVYAALMARYSALDAASVGDKPAN